MNFKKNLVLLIVFGFIFSGCATIGQDFPSSKVNLIETGVTTKADIEKMFGTPWRTGMENGEKTWTYGFYKYRSIGESSTKDLLIKFSSKGIVSSYSFNTTELEEKK
ncbi:MAG: outer membrane protein assembly factor BamE [Desulforegulaceae bacterium]|nr:outer membrane protein assembly factor BamE [Desulforegulaceae bacterium]